MKLRAYQQEAVDSIAQYFTENTGNPLVVLPTGAGKSIVIAAFIKLVMQYKNQRIIVLTHVKELIEQNHKTLMSHWHEAWNLTGIYSAGLNKRDTCDEIIFASIQSVYQRSGDLGRFDLLIIDECHLINTTSNTMYQKFISGQKEMNPKVKIVGFTATPFRTATGDITTAKNALFDGICFDKNMLELIDDKYLAPIISKRTDTQIDLSSVKTRGGEFVEKELQKATDKESITKAAISEIITYGKNRQSWLIFCAGVEHVNHIYEALIECNINAAYITGKTPRNKRDEIIQGYKDKKIKAIASCDVLTTGFDAPGTDLIALLRGTQSPGLYVQMVGRGMRVSGGKENCLVLDFANNVIRHGPVDEVRPWTPGKKMQCEAPSKTCRECQSILAASAKICPDCGYVFEFEYKSPHEAYSGNMPIISTEKIIEEHVVNDVFFNLHYKKSNPDARPTIKITYRCGIRTFPEWICIFHDGFPGNKARSWWHRFVLAKFPASNVWSDFKEEFEKMSEILKEKYIKPKAIVVNHSDKYPRVVNYVQ